MAQDRLEKSYLQVEAHMCVRAVADSGGWTISEVHNALSETMFRKLEMILLRKWNIRIITLPEESYCILLLTNYGKKHVEKIIKESHIIQFNSKVRQRLKDEAIERKMYDGLMNSIKNE